MEFSRRDLFRTGLAVGGAAAVGGALAAGGAAAAAGSPSLGSAAPALPTATAAVATLQSRLTVGPPGAGGYRRVISVAGEPHLTRADLGAAASPDRAATRTPILAFVQLSDVHVVDAQSPLRVEFADRLGDTSSLPEIGLLDAGYRPQEMLSGQIADSMVAAINAIAVGPVTGRPFDMAIQTGDNSDNSQRNEIRWGIDLLDGADGLRIDSGNLSRWEGVADDNRATYDPAYWHPHGTPTGKRIDRPRGEWGFPTIPGLLDAARRPFDAVGLNMPWYSVFGNHDGLAQGNVPIALGLGIIATGNLKIISTPLGLHPGVLVDKLLQDPTGLLSALAVTGGVRAVTRDPNRRLLTRKQIVEEHFRTSGLPVGHGFTEGNRRAGTAHYSFDQGACRFVVLDTVNPNGLADGSLDKPQFQWLCDLLAQSTDSIVIIVSHHTSSSMNNPLVATGGDLRPRVLGDEVRDLLLASPQVVAWVNGHTHTNRVAPRPNGTGGGFWEITTASHIDWPQQARLLEVVDNRDGTLSIFSTVVDHAGPVEGGTADARQLAGLARELAANDWHTHEHGSGAALDRNVELVVADPRR